LGAKWILIRSEVYIDALEQAVGDSHVGLCQPDLPARELAVLQAHAQIRRTRKKVVVTFPDIAADRRTRPISESKMEFGREQIGRIIDGRGDGAADRGGRPVGGRLFLNEVVADDSIEVGGSAFALDLPAIE